MLANIIIMILILGYCAFIIYKSVKNTKEGNIRGVPDAVETVEAAVDAAVLLFIRTPRSLLRIV